MDLNEIMTISFSVTLFLMNEEEDDLLFEKNKNFEGQN